jgi:uncharacterized membrane protein YraQ (UPF0718 family)
MLIPTLVMAALAVLLLALGYFRGQSEHLAGLRSSLNMTLSVLPLLVCAFVMAGMVQVLLPKELVAQWIGAESGIRGILLGAFVGGLAPGGPYVSLPIAIGLVRSGAGMGTIVAFLTGWSLYAVGRLPMEIGILGWKLTLVRLVSVLVFPPLAGLIAHVFFSHVKP